MMLNAPIAQQLLKPNDTGASALPVSNSSVVESGGLAFADLFERAGEGSSIGSSHVSASTESEIKGSEVIESHILESSGSERDMDETYIDLTHATLEQEPQKKSQGESGIELGIQKENLGRLPTPTQIESYFKQWEPPSSNVAATQHLKVGSQDVIPNVERQVLEQKVETNAGVSILSAGAGSYLNKAVLRGDVSLEAPSATRSDIASQGVGDQGHLQSESVEPALIVNGKVKPDLVGSDYYPIVSNENTESMDADFVRQKTAVLQFSGSLEDTSETQIPTLEQRYHQQAPSLRSLGENARDETLKPGYLPDRAAQEFEERIKPGAIEPVIVPPKSEAQVLPVAALERFGSFVTSMEKSDRHFEMSAEARTTHPESVQDDISEEQYKISDVRAPIPTFGNQSPFAEVVLGKVSAGRDNARELISSEALIPFSQAEHKSSLGQAPSLAAPVLNAERAIVIVRDALDAMANTKKREIELQLHPKELGKLRFVMSSGEGQMLVQVFAERPETLEALRRHGDILAREFSSEGFDTTSFDFSQDTSNRKDILPSSKGEDAALDPSQSDLEISRYEWRKSDARLDVRI